MNYVISGISGMYDRYMEMLEKTDFSDSDILYVLGNCADRGPDGIKVWLEPENVGEGFMQDLELWMRNGGKATYDAFKVLDRNVQEKILWSIHAFALNKKIEVNGERYFLSHTIGETADRPLNKYTPYEYVWGRPDYSECYDENAVLVTGHTPTGAIDKDYAGRIYIKNNHIAVDCGAAFRQGKLGCICLDTMEEFYC